MSYFRKRAVWQILGASLGLTIISTAIAAPFDADLATKIDTYLTGKASPIAGNGSSFVTSGINNNVDPRLIVAIAGQESSFGKNWVNCKATDFNAWSWFYKKTCAASTFTSFAAGGDYVANGLRRLYLNRGLTTIEQISTVYCGKGPDCPPWAANVKSFYVAQGGDPTDLSYQGAQTVDFEQFAGGSVFTSAQAPLTVGMATISGGQVLANTVNLPANQSKVYGTSYFCQGCASAITINFAQKVSNVSMWVLNGQTVTVTYTIRDDTGGTKSVTLAPNFNSGYTTVFLDSKSIVRVTIAGNIGQYDFFIDNLRYSPG